MKPSQSLSPTGTSGSATVGRRLETKCIIQGGDVKAQCDDCADSCGHRLLKQFECTGYVCLPACLPSADEFNVVYEAFDRLFGKNADPKLAGMLARDAQLWNGVPGNSSAYSDAPVGFRDRRMRDDKANKVYFQFTEEFGAFLRGIRGSSYEWSSDLRVLCTKLSEVVSCAERVFRWSLASLEHAIPAIKDLRLSGTNLSILVKVLGYYPGDEYATLRHYDKSLLTLVLNASDMANDKLRVGPYGSGRSADSLSIPDRSVDRPSEPSTGVLFPGTMWGKLGIGELLPSPHEVLPVTEQRVRYSAIAFLIAPGLDTSDLVTTH